MFQSIIPCTALRLPLAGSISHHAPSGSGPEPYSSLSQRLGQDPGQRGFQHVDDGQVVGAEVGEQFGQSRLAGGGGVALQQPGSRRPRGLRWAR